jgi:hypothetical protein
MKLTHQLTFTLIFTLSACGVHRLIDQKDDCIWIGSDSEKYYLLSIDNAEGIWFTGKIFINFTDTLFIKGFQKGSNHPTTVSLTTKDSINNKSLGHIFIYTIGNKADTIKIKNSIDSISQLPLNLILIKTNKSNKKLI